MKRRRKHIWTYEEVEKAKPFVRSILLTIRDRVIQANSATIVIMRMTKRNGRLSRVQMIEMENLKRIEQEADRDIGDALDELRGIGAYCSDPIQAIAAFPFRARGTWQNGVSVEGAWFLYSPFGDELYWRFDGEGETVRHELKELKL